MQCYPILSTLVRLRLLLLLVDAERWFISPNDLGITVTECFCEQLEYAIVCILEQTSLVDVILAQLACNV